MGGQPGALPGGVAGAVHTVGGGFVALFQSGHQRLRRKINYFADLYLQRQMAEKARWSAGGAIFRAAWRFVRSYFIRLGFLDGYPGFFIAASTGYSTLVRHSRLFEHLAIPTLRYARRPNLPDHLHLRAARPARPGVARCAAPIGNARRDHASRTTAPAPATRELIGQWQKTSGHARCAISGSRTIGFRKTMILNKSVAAAKGEYIVLLDGDCVPHREFIADHAALAEKNFWVQGRRCFVQEEFAPGVFRRRHAGLALDVHRAHHRRWQGGSAAVADCAPQHRPAGHHRLQHGIWREDLVAINGFDEEYTGWGIGEDSDLGARLYHLGRPRKFVYGHAIVYHLNHPPCSGAPRRASRQRLAETIRSGKIRCERGHGPIPRRLRLPHESHC